MTTPFVQYTATAGQTEFDVTFPFISRLHVEVFVNDVSHGIISWINDHRVKVPTVSAGSLVEIVRVTPIDGPLVEFQNGAVLTQEDLNLAILQLLYRQQELQALYDNSLKRARVRLAENLGIVTDPEAIVDELINLVAEDELLATFNSRVADIDANAQAVVDEASARVAEIIRLEGLIGTGGDPDGYAELVTQVDTNVTDIAANVTSITALLAGLGDANAAILNEQTARVAADSSFASDLTALITRVSDAEAAIVTESTARADQDAALASQITVLDTDIGAVEASVVAEQTARAAGDGALASDITLLTTRMGTAEADILSESTARSNADSALTTSLNGALSRLDTAETAIITEQTTRASADTALSSSVTSLTTTVGGNTASIGTLQSSTDGLLLKHGVSLNSNGHVTGFLQNNNGTSGSFTVVADIFAIVDPGDAGNSFVPFEVSNGVVRIKEAVIGSLQIDKLTTGTLGVDFTLDGDISVGNGKIVWDNGSFMKVIGVGFGTSNQFIEWYGPTRAISACNEADATAYLKTNGDAYWGGSLAAGVLFNAAQTSLTASNASVVVGPFGTNGANKSVVLSYDYRYTAVITGSASWTGSPSATLVIERSFNGTSWTTIGTLPVTGNVSGEDGFGGDPGEVVQQMSGSLTVTDTNGSTSDFYYRGRLTARNLATVTSTITSGPSETQRVGVSSTEA